jgi:hypothetical protein
LRHPFNGPLVSIPFKPFKSFKSKSYLLFIMIASVVPGAPTNFRTWFQEAGRDPYGGTYNRVMAAFEVPAAGTGWLPGRVLNSTLGAGDSYANTFIGLFPYPGEDAGRTRLVHTPLRFPSVMGRPTPYDNKAYVFFGDVVSGVASTVVYETTSFNLANSGAWTIPKDYPTALNAWAADTAVDLLDAMTAGADTRPCNVPRLMYVPPKYIPILLDWRLTPRQLIDELCGTIATDGKLNECAALVSGERIREGDQALPSTITVGTGQTGTVQQ